MFSLEKLCIDLIVQKFERFYFAFTVSEDENLQPHFEFLQRRYSVQFLKALYKGKKLEGDYFELLINENLKYLKGKWLENGRCLVFMEDIFRRLPNLTRIRFRDCGDEILENVAKFCPKIIEIDVNGSNVTDNGVKYLCDTKNGMAPCPELKNIFVDDSDVTDKGVENLIRNLPSLEKIGYSNVPKLLHSIHTENLLESGNMQLFNLVELDLLQSKRLPNYTDVLQSCLTVCPKLESLKCYIYNKEQLNLFSNCHLKNLNLEFTKTHPEISIDKFLKMNGWKLIILIITDCTISVSVLGMYCPNIRQFSGHHVNFTDDNDDLKLNFACLIECDFVDIEPLSNQAVRLLLSSSPKLESVSFMFCNLSRKMKTQILSWCKNPCAKKILLIDTFKTTLDMEFLKNILLNCPSLKEMRVLSMSLYFGDSEMVESLENIAKRLPNKPLVVVE